jgi:hypothetical protein
MTPIVTWSARAGLWWRGPGPTQPLRPWSNPWSCPVWGRSETHPFLLLGYPVLAHHQHQKQCTVRNWVTEVDLRSTEWSRKFIFCGKQWGLFLMVSDWSLLTVSSLQHISLASDTGPLMLKGIHFLAQCRDQIPFSSYSLYQARPPFWSLPRPAWVFIVFKQNILSTFHGGNSFFHLEIGSAVCGHYFTINVQAYTPWSDKKEH